MKKANRYIIIYIQSTATACSLIPRSMQYLMYPVDTCAIWLRCDHLCLTSLFFREDDNSRAKGGKKENVSGRIATLLASGRQFS